MTHVHKLKNIASIFAISLIVACSNGEKTKSQGQIIANVNNEEISIHQLNYVLTHSGLTDEKQVEQTKIQLLKRLVDQSLIEQQAKTDKMDRDPNVLLAMESAKRQILSEAWLQRQLQNIEKPDAAEIAEFYKTHPELFEKRKVYQLKEVKIESTDDNRKQIDALIQSNPDVNNLTTALAAQKVSFTTNQATLAAEQLPMEQLPILYALPIGHYISLQNEKGQLIIGVLSSKDSTIDAEKANTFIQSFLINERRNKMAEAAIQHLRNVATIQYLGPFADLNQKTSTPPASSESVPVKEKEEDGTKKLKDSISRGAAGLN